MPNKEIDSVCDHTFIFSIFIVRRKNDTIDKIKMVVVRIGSLLLFILIIQCKY